MEPFAFIELFIPPPIGNKFWRFQGEKYNCKTKQKSKTFSISAYFFGFTCA